MWSAGHGAHVITTMIMMSVILEAFLWHSLPIRSPLLPVAFIYCLRGGPFGVAAPDTLFITYSRGPIVDEQRLRCAWRPAET